MDLNTLIFMFLKQLESCSAVCIIIASIFIWEWFFALIESLGKKILPFYKGKSLLVSFKFIPHSQNTLLFLLLPIYFPVGQILLNFRFFKFYIWLESILSMVILKTLFLKWFQIQRILTEGGLIIF